MQEKKTLCVQFEVRKNLIITIECDFRFRIHMTSPNILAQFRTICGAGKKHFRVFKNTFRKNIAPENSPAKFLGPKEFSGFLINEQQLIHGSSAVRLAYLYILVEKTLLVPLGF